MPAAAARAERARDRLQQRSSSSPRWRLRGPRATCAAGARPPLPPCWPSVGKVPKSSTALRDAPCVRARATLRAQGVQQQARARDAWHVAQLDEARMCTRTSRGRSSSPRAPLMAASPPLSGNQARVVVCSPSLPPSSPLSLAFAPLRLGARCGRVARTSSGKTDDAGGRHQHATPPPAYHARRSGRRGAAWQRPCSRRNAVMVTRARVYEPEGACKHSAGR